MSQPKKSSGLAAFTESVAPTAATTVVASQEPPAARGQRVRGAKGRTRGINERVGVSLRLTHEAWRRVHDLALTEGISLQQLIVNALSQDFRRRGLPPLEL